MPGYYGGMSIFCIVLVVSLLAGAAQAQTPVYDPPVAIEADGVPIHVGFGGNASPFVVDWDGDGRQDLLLGQFSGGKVRFYRNVGEHFDPVFETFECLYSGLIN